MYCESCIKTERIEIETETIREHNTSLLRALPYVLVLQEAGLIGTSLGGMNQLGSRRPVSGERQVSMSTLTENNVEELLLSVLSGTTSGLKVELDEAMCVVRRCVL